MGFSSPWMLIAVAATAIPVLIHLVGRRRAPRVRFAAVDYLLRANRRVARQVRLRHLLLLATRVLLLLALALMVARPYRNAPVALPLLGAGPASVVLIIDDTASMRRVHDGTSLFSRAKARARQLIDALSGGAEVAILAMSRPRFPLARLTRDRREALRALARIEPGFAHAKLAGALVAARRLLSRGTLGTKQIFVFSDMAEHSLDATARTLAKEARIDVIDVAPAKGGNRAVVAVHSRAAPQEGHRAMRIEARLCNYSDAAVVLRPRLEVDTRYVARGRVALDAQSCGTKAFHHTFARSGTHRAVVSIDSDSFEADDRRYLYLEVQSPLRVLLVNGDPSPLRHKDELFYLRAALETPAARQRSMLVSVSDAAGLERAALATLDVVGLCNLRDVSPDAAAALEAFVRRGGGLFVSVGANTDAGRMNNVLGAMLPQPLRGPAGSAGTQTALRLGRVDGRHPILVGLSVSAEGVVGLGKSRFFTSYRLKPAPGKRGRTVLSYDDGSPTLVEKTLGEGRVLLLTTSVDRDWTDLPIRPGYLPLMQQIFRHLGRAVESKREAQLLVGGVRRLKVDAASERVELFTPKGERDFGRAELGAKGEVDITVDAPGFYRLRAADARGTWRNLDGLGFAVNLDPAESRLKKGKLEVAAALAAKADGRPQRRVDLAHLVALFALVFFFGEALLTRRG